MRCFFKVMLALVVPVVASAVPVCTTNTMASYQALGATGCMLGDFVFSNFTYTYNLTNSSPAYFQSAFGEMGLYPDVPNTEVRILPTVVGAGLVNLNFGNASWVVAGWQQATLTVTFDLHMVSNALNAVSAGFAGSLSGIGTESVFGSVNPPNAAIDFVTDEPSGGGGGTYVYPTTAPSYPVHVKLQTTLNGNTPTSCIVLGVDLCDGNHDNEAFAYITDTAYNNGAHMSVFDTSFYSTAAPPPSTPEPGTWMLVGAGIGLAGLIKKRRAAC